MIKLVITVLSFLLIIACNPIVTTEPVPTSSPTPETTLTPEPTPVLTPTALPTATITAQELHPWIRIHSVEERNAKLNQKTQSVGLMSLEPLDAFDLYLFCAAPWNSIVLYSYTGWPEKSKLVYFSYWHLTERQEVYQPDEFYFELEEALADRSRSPILIEGALEFTNTDQMNQIIEALKFVEANPEITLLIGVYDGIDPQDYPLAEFNIVNLDGAFKHASCFQN